MSPATGADCRQRRQSWNNTHTQVCERMQMKPDDALEAALQAAECRHKHFHRENVRHSTRQGDYIMLFMSPVVVLPGEAVKAAAEVVIRDGIATATNWFTGRANTPPEHDRQLGEMYEAHGFYRPAPSHATFLALVDQALRHAGEIRARHWANFHRLSDERLDGDEVVVVAHANGLATFAERWHTYILPIRDDACSVQGVSYGHRNQRFDFDIENGKIVRATRYTLKPALL